MAQILLYTEARTTGKQTGNAYIAAHAVLTRYLWRQQERQFQVLHLEVPCNESPLASEGL